MSSSSESRGIDPRLLTLQRYLRREENIDSTRSWPTTENAVHPRQSHLSQQYFCNFDLSLFVLIVLSHWTVVQNGKQTRFGQAALLLKHSTPLDNRAC